MRRVAFGLLPPVVILLLSISRYLFCAPIKKGSDIAATSSFINFLDVARHILDRRHTNTMTSSFSFRVGCYAVQGKLANLA